MNPLAEDLEHILTRTAPLWPDLSGARLFITGGTGFFGRWLLESFCQANRVHQLRAEAVVLTRDPAGFARQCPGLAADSALCFVPGDIRHFAFPPGEFTHVIHAATPASAQLNADEPLTMWETIVDGTRRVLELALARGVRGFLLTSSGAVYGPQPPELLQLPETYAGGPDTLNPASAYAEGKRAAEYLCVATAQAHGLPVKIARCFAFVGPHLPLDAHFAAGNFLRDALHGGPIRVSGDGTPYRSYLYAADLAIWLWTILLRGAPGRAYNVGSDDAVTISELAHLIAGLTDPPCSVEIARSPAPGPAARYVPSVARAQEELGLQVTVPLPLALRRTLAWAAGTSSFAKQAWML